MRSRVVSTLLTWSVVLAPALVVTALFTLRRESRRATTPKPSSTEAMAPPSEQSPIAVDERFLGVVVPREAVDLTSKVGGRLRQVYVQVGQHVAVGEKIADIDDESVRHELALAEASLSGARAKRSRATIELSGARDGNTRRKAVQSELSQEELASGQLKERLGSASVDEASAHVSEERAHVEALRDALKNTEIRAPFEGTVAARYRDPGSIVGPSVPIVRLIQSGDLSVRFAVPVARAFEVTVSTPVDLTIDSLHAVLPGRVAHVPPEVDPASQMLFVEASIDIAPEWQAKLQSGLVGHVTRHQPLPDDTHTGGR